MANHSALIGRNAARWDAAKLTRGPAFNPVAKRLVAAKPRYQAVEARTGVPWFIIAVIHEREASQRWDRQLGQGDPLNRVSTHVPKGRGPFKSWEDGAYDALVNCAPFASKWKDWTPGGAMTLLELYNGLGYSNKGRPSPYVWAGTNQYAKGKYVADGVYDANVVDKQLGCAGLILAMMSIDTSVRIDKKPAIPSMSPVPVQSVPVPKAPVITAKTGAAGAAIVAAGAGTVAVAAQTGHSVTTIVLIAAGFVAAAIVGWLAIRHFTKRT